MSEILRFQNVSYSYAKGMPAERKAIDDVSFSVESCDFIGIYGISGSGKSTLLKLAAGLIKPSSGHIVLKENTRVGLVFQFPENQLFGSTVLDDVMFGPLNMGLDKERARQRAETALRQVGLGPELYGRSPFALSGGEKRRAAIAGILAMDTEVLALDEPLAGLDSEGQEELCAILERLNAEGRTIIIVSHDSDVLGRRCRKAVVLENGRISDCGSSGDVFSRNLGFAPLSFRVMEKVKAMGINL